MPRKPKYIQYVKERREILNTILNIVQYDGKSFYLNIVKDNPEKQQQILDLVPQIKKYFVWSRIFGIKQNKINPEVWLSIIKHVVGQFYQIDKIQTTAKETYLEAKTRIKKGLKQTKTIKYFLKPLELKAIFNPIGDGKYEVITYPIPN